jgi:hypothetical protein
MRNFYEQDRYRWEMTTEYGYEVSKEELRDNRIGQVLGSEKVNINLHYIIALKKKDESGWGAESGSGAYIGLYQPREKKLKIYPLSEDGGVRVEFIAEDIEECETYVDLVCKGNNMELMPVNIKS